VIGVMGNSDHHVEVFHLLLRYGGAVIGHDARMLGFYRHINGDAGAARQASRELGREITQTEVARWAQDESQLQTLYYGELAEVAEPLIVHAASSAELIRARYGTPVTYLPFADYHPWTDAQLDAPSRAAARAQLGIDANEIAIATFGYIAHNKYPAEIIDALATLRARGVKASLRFVGDTLIPPDALRAHAAARGVGGHVHVLNTYVTEAMFRAHLLAADLGIQLRAFDFGSISGALMDCATAGLPTVAGRSLASALVTPSYISTVADAPDPAEIAEAWMTLLAAGGRANPRWREERRSFSAERSFETYAVRLCAALGLETSAG
jgi:glycosyltransferase involved in cell wall biosynthesis